jgi:hypothetical protein
MFRSGHLGVVLLCVAGCALPNGSVILLRAPSASLEPATRAIAPEWDGRLLRVSESAPSLGGEATHVHAMPHRHEATSGPASHPVKPFGLSMVGAKATHVHALMSTSHTPLATGPGNNVPPARELHARLMARSLLHVRPGVIVAYVGTDVPRGWALCDGTAGTPDLRDLYVVMRRESPDANSVGADLHQHEVSHGHAWSSAPPNPELGRNFAFLNDPAPPADPNIQVSRLDHQHAVAEDRPYTGQTEPLRVRPPSVRVRFIQALDGARGMPRGALLPFVRDDVPLGWTGWTRIGDVEVIGRFLLATADITQLGSTLGSEGHHHTFSHSHDVELRPDPSPPIGGRVHVGPEVAASDHGHRAHAELRVDTGPAVHLPPHVSLRFIRKRGFLEE